MFRKTLAVLLLFALVVAQGEDEFVDDVEDAAEDIADLAEEEVDEEADAASDEVAAAADAAVADLTDIAPEGKSIEEQYEEEDLWVLLIGISSALDTLWWILWGWFIYVKTNDQDSTMCVNSDCVVQILPIAWFWSSFAHTTLSWTALTYFWIWMFYMLISIPEMAFWIMHMITEDKKDIGHWLFNMWVSYPGLYGSWVFYFFPVLFPIIQLSSLTGINQSGYTNAGVQLAMMMISWLFTGIVHVLGYPFVNRKFARWGHLPAVLPGAEASVSEEATEAAEEVANEADDSAADLLDTAEEGLDDLEDDVSDAADAVEEVADDTADW